MGVDELLEVLEEELMGVDELLEVLIEVEEEELMGLMSCWRC